MLARVFKDIFPRFKTMRGYYVERKGGWDCHGLPVEIAVEQELGISSKAEIEAYGIAEFNAKCRESVFTFLEDWDRLTERIGFWVDLEDAYRTLDAGYVESVWWALKTIWDARPALRGPQGRALLPALRHRAVQPRGGAWATRTWSIRASTCDSRCSRAAARSSPVTSWSSGRRRPGRSSRTRQSAIAPELTYVRASAGDGPPLVLAEALVGKVLGDEAEILDRFSGSDIEGLRYEPPFSFIAAAEYGERGHTVLAADFVTAEDGSGLVHTAIAFGEDDFRLGREAGLNVVNPVRLDGTYDERIGPYAGRSVKDADADLVEDLRARGRLLRSEDYEHAYPHCWRCGTPLLYYAKPSWYIATSTLRDRLLANNETIAWHPPHISDGRFGEWLRGQRRLGALARALLGHAAADLALRAGACPLRRFARGARAALGSAARRSAPPLRR